MTMGVIDQSLMTAARIPIPLTGLTDWVAFQFSLPPNAVQNAFWTIAVGAVCSICCAIAGCFLVLRRMSLLGDALSHSVLAGTAAVYLLTGQINPFPMLVGALSAGVMTAVLTQFVHKHADVPEDSSIGIVFTSLFAFGVVVVSQARGVHLDLDCVLFGDLALAGVNLHDVGGYLWPKSFQTLIPSLIVSILFVCIFWKELKVSSFDPIFATTIGLSAGLMHYLLTTVVAVVTISAMEVVGLLVVALLIVPASIARLLTEKLGTMLWLSSLIGITCSTSGYLLALWLDSSAAGLTAVTAGMLLLTAIVFSPKDGLLVRLSRTIRLRIRICAEDVLAGLFRQQERSDTPEAVVETTRSHCLELAGGGLLANPALKWLQTQNLLTTGAGRISLTNAGAGYARSLIRSHRLWESYLLEHFNLPPDHLHDPAEEMEHYIGPEMQQRIKEELAAPAEDPHGRSIPD